MENKHDNNSIQQKQKRIVRFAFIAILILAPLVYLFYKTRTIDPLPAAQQAQPGMVSNIAQLEKMATENPSFDNLVNLSMAYINNKQAGKSVDHLKRAIELKPTSAIAYNNLGVAYIMLEQYQNGIDACTKAIELDGTFQLAKNNLKWCLDEKAKVVAKIDEQMKVSKDKQDAKFLIDFGLNYFKIGDYSKSIEIWNNVLTIDPKNVIAFNSIGTAFMMKNQLDDALSVFEQCLAIDPNNQQTKNNINWAKGEKAKAVK